jgi:hypothetical protein
MTNYFRWAFVTMAISLGALACSAEAEDSDESDEELVEQTQEQQQGLDSQRCVPGGLYCGGQGKNRLGGKTSFYRLYRCVDGQKVKREMYCGTAGCYTWPRGYDDACYPPS